MRKPFLEMWPFVRHIMSKYFITVLYLNSLIMPIIADLKIHKSSIKISGIFCQLYRDGLGSGLVVVSLLTVVVVTYYH